MNLFKNLPDEILVTLFCYLDKESKQIAAEVCRHWRILIHDMSWKHITRLVEGDITMTADFSNFGWEENNHEFGQCRCIELHLRNPFNSVSWKNASYDDDAAFTDVYDSSMVFEQSKVICAEPYIRKRKKGKWVSIVDLHELDLTETSPSWKAVKEIAFEPKGMNGHVVVSTELKSYGKTLVLKEILDGARERLEEVRITLWNIETWEFVSQLPIQETINEIMKLKLTMHGVSEPNFEIWKIDLLFEVSSDIIVIGANVDIDTGTMWSLLLFWKFDASNPAVALPNFMTYILEEEDNDPLHLYLNARYFSERKRKKLQVFLIDDIKNNATSKSWNIQLKSGYEDKCLLEGGKSNRLAVINGTRSELKVINIKSGECMLLLNFNTIIQLTSENMWKFCENIPPQMQFHLGKLILIQSLRLCDDRKKYRHKIVIADEMGLKVNNFVLDTSCDKEETRPSFYFGNPRFFLGSSSIVMKHLNKTHHWLLTANPKSREEADAKDSSRSAVNDLVDLNLGPGESSSGQPGSAAAGQSTEPCGGMSLQISTSVSSSPSFNAAKPALDGPRA